jgi:hypothetical protein
MSLRFATGALFAIVLASSPALACKGPNVVFADSFAEADPGWGTNDQLVIGSNRAQLKSQPGGVAGSFYTGSFFDDADICIDVTSPAARNPAEVNAGLVFWADDWDNFYMFQITPDGQASIYRSQKGKTIFPVSWRKADAVKPGANAVNTLRLTLKGGNGTAYVNDKQFVAFKGMPPKGGSLIGLFSASENGAVNIWSFSNLKITDAH